MKNLGFSILESCKITYFQCKITYFQYDVGYIGVSKNKGFYPPNPWNFNDGVSMNFHHPFWGVFPLFLETPTCVKYKGPCLKHFPYPRILGMSAGVSKTPLFRPQGCY